jgi:hypothetical protein
MHGFITRVCHAQSPHAGSPPRSYDEKRERQRFPLCLDGANAVLRSVLRRLCRPIRLIGHVRSTAPRSRELHPARVWVCCDACMHVSDQSPCTRAHAFVPRSTQCCPCAAILTTQKTPVLIDDARTHAWAAARELQLIYRHAAACGISSASLPLDRTIYIGCDSLSIYLLRMQLTQIERTTQNIKNICTTKHIYKKKQS